MKDIMLKLKGMQTGSDGEEELTEFMTEGKLYKRNGSYYLLYEESEISGMEGCKTSLKYNENFLRMKRTGNTLGEYTVIEFNKDKRFSSLYQTPYGPIEMEVMTNIYDHKLTEEGMGSILIDYNVSLIGLTATRNRLNITISEQ